MNSPNNIKIHVFYAALLLLFAGLTYAAPRVVVVPLGDNSLNIIETLALRISELEAKLACISSSSNDAQLLIDGCDVSVSGESTISLAVGDSSIALSNAELKLNSMLTEVSSTSTSIKGTGRIDLVGGLISGGALPVARLGDTVTVNLSTGVGTITTGSSTVQF